MLSFSGLICEEEIPPLRCGMARGRTNCESEKQILRLRRRMTTKKTKAKTKANAEFFPFDKLRVRMTNKGNYSL
jgi:hypothetical protein